MKAILAINNNGVIGDKGSIPWYSTDDLQHFKRMTIGQRLLVGRKTFEKLPGLRNRTLYIVGTGYMTLENALSKNPDWIIGGAEIFRQTLHLCSELHVSYIDDDSDGDTTFSIDGYAGKIFEYHFTCRTKNTTST